MHRHAVAVALLAALVALAPLAAARLPLDPEGLVELVSGNLSGSGGGNGTQGPTDGLPTQCVSVVGSEVDGHTLCAGVSSPSDADPEAADAAPLETPATEAAAPEPQPVRVSGPAANATPLDAPRATEGVALEIGRAHV